MYQIYSMFLFIFYMYSPMSREQSSSFPPEYYEQRAALLASVTGKTKEALRTYIEKKEGEQ